MDLDEIFRVNGSSVLLYLAIIKFCAAGQRSTKMAKNFQLRISLGVTLQQSQQIQHTSTSGPGKGL